MRKYIKKPRCIDCGRIVRGTEKIKSPYKGDLCLECKMIRTASNKKAWDRQHRKKRYKNSSLKKYIYDVINQYGLSHAVRTYIKKQAEFNFLGLEKRVETIARREARRTAYTLLLMWGAKSILHLNPDIKDDRRGIKSKMVEEINESLQKLLEKGVI